MTCPDEARAKVMLSKLQTRFRNAKVEKLKTESYYNIGFTPVQVGSGRADPTFPKYYETGDNPLDSRSYRIEKLQWLSEHPVPGADEPVN